MPIYLYKNLNTSETFEHEQRITDAALTHHPETGDPVKRLIQPVGIAFKGSGFYVTDSRSSNGVSKPSKPESADTSTKNEPKAASTSESGAKSTPASSKPKAESAG